jgi:hypothetical protein
VLTATVRTHGCSCERVGLWGLVWRENRLVYICSWRGSAAGRRRESRGEVEPGRWPQGNTGASGLKQQRAAGQRVHLGVRCQTQTQAHPAPVRGRRHRGRWADGGEEREGEGEEGNGTGKLLSPASAGCTGEVAVALARVADLCSSRPGGAAGGGAAG